MRSRNKAARSSCSYSRAKMSTATDAHILAYDILLAVSGAVLIVGVPFVMAVLKQWGWW